MTRIHGKKGLIYLSGSEVTVASVCNIGHTTDSEEGPVFNDTYPERAVGLFHWGGSVSVWAQTDSKTLQGAAQAGFSVALLAYPDRAVPGSFYSGNVIVSFEHGIDVSAIQGVTGAFEGDGDLALTGFS